MKSLCSAQTNMSHVQSFVQLTPITTRVSLCSAYHSRYTCETCVPLTIAVQSEFFVQVTTTSTRVNPCLAYYINSFEA